MLSIYQVTSSTVNGKKLEGENFGESSLTKQMEREIFGESTGQSSVIKLHM